MVVAVVPQRTVNRSHAALVAQIDVSSVGTVVNAVLAADVGVGGTDRHALQGVVAGVGAGRTVGSSHAHLSDQIGV